MILGTTIQQRFRIRLSAVQVRALGSTPVLLVGSPGAGRFIHLLSLVAHLVPGGVAHATSAALEVRYGFGGDAIAELPGACLAGGRELSVATVPDGLTGTAQYEDRGLYLAAGAAVTGSGSGELILNGAFVVLSDVETGDAPVDLFDYSVDDYSVDDYSITNLEPAP